MANELVTSILLTTTTTLAHTVSGGLVALCYRLNFLNIDTGGGGTNHQVTVWSVPTGETLGVQHKILASVNIKPGKPLNMLFQAHLQAGDTLHWAADATNKVKAGACVTEVTPNGHENIKAQFLGTSLAPLHTITTGYEMTLLSLLLANQDSVSRGVEIQSIPQGQSAASKHQFLDVADTIPANKSRIFRYANEYLGAGGTIQGKASAANAVVVAGAVFEEAT